MCIWLLFIGIKLERRQRLRRRRQLHPVTFPYFIDNLSKENHLSAQALQFLRYTFLSHKKQIIDKYLEVWANKMQRARKKRIINNWQHVVVRCMCDVCACFFGVQSVIEAIYNANNIVKLLIFSRFATIRLAKFAPFYCSLLKIFALAPTLNSIPIERIW